MSELHVLDDIPLELEPERVMRKARMDPGMGLDDEIAKLVEEAVAVGRPKAMFRLAYPELRDDTTVSVDGVAFSSRVLRVNLDQAKRVFAYVATCGTELDAWAQAKEDPLVQFLADAIKELALGQATRALNHGIVERFRPGPTSAMAPGSLADWPLLQQRPLFQLLGDVAATIGVTLSESCLMIPNKSISGIRFPTQESFESCMLCPRPDCPSRRAPHDPALYQERYAASTAGENQG